MNAARCKFIREALCRHFGREPGVREPLAGLRLLDVGCGGGLLCVHPRAAPSLLPEGPPFARDPSHRSFFWRPSGRVEPLARMGAHVTGIDAVEKNIRVAEAHARLDPALASRTEYRTVLAEELAEEGATFDCVVSLEARARCRTRRRCSGAQRAPVAANERSCSTPERAEGPSRPPDLVRRSLSTWPTCACSCRRSPRSSSQGAAPSSRRSTAPPSPSPWVSWPPSGCSGGCLQALTSGTSSFNQRSLRVRAPALFLSCAAYHSPQTQAPLGLDFTLAHPSLAAAMAEAGLTLEEVAGMAYRPVSDSWALSSDLSMNYIAMARKGGA